MHIVFSVGGSKVNPDGKIDIKFLKELAQVIKKYSSSIKFGILTGGGFAARVHATAARELGANEYEADTIAITSTKQNAQMVVAALKAAEVDVFPQALTDFELAKGVQNKVVVMGGTIPGLTTDTDSVLLAEALGAKKLINLSNVDGVYESDPRTNPKAKKHATLSYTELISLANESDKRMAGTHFVFDILACKLIARSKIETHFVKEIEDVKKVLENKNHNGTVVR